MAHLAKRKRRLWDAYAFPGVRPQPTVRGAFGDPKARVIVWRHAHLPGDRGSARAVSNLRARERQAGVAGGEQPIEHGVPAQGVLFPKSRNYLVTTLCFNGLSRLG